MVMREIRRNCRLHGEPPSRRERRLLTAAGLSLLAYLALVLWTESSSMALDHVARSAVHVARHPLLQGPMAEISRLGTAEGLVTLIALGSVALWRSHRAWALALPGLMAGTGVLQFVAKWSVDRPRPDLTAWGFPSGHVLSLVVFFGLMAYLGSISATSRRCRRLVVALCTVPVVLVAFSRMYLDRHWL